MVFYKVYEKYQDFSLYRYLCINFYKRSLPQDIASSAGVSFSINHIAAVVIPALLGMLWIINSSWVFYIGAGFAVCSLGLSMLIPKNPTTGGELRSQEH